MKKKIVPRSSTNQPTNTSPRHGLPSFLTREVVVALGECRSQSQLQGERQGSHGLQNRIPIQMRLAALNCGFRYIWRLLTSHGARKPVTMQIQSPVSVAMFAETGAPFWIGCRPETDIQKKIDGKITTFGSLRLTINFDPQIRLSSVFKYVA